MGGSDRSHIVSLCRFCVVVTFFCAAAVAAMAAAAALDFCIKLQYKTLNRYIVNEFFIRQPQHFHSIVSPFLPPPRFAHHSGHLLLFSCR